MEDKEQEFETDHFQKSRIFEEEIIASEFSISVFDELVIDDPKSIFVTLESKIESDSIYDNQSKKVNQTRFGKLPTKLEKTNMPVTFHKKIKSSGYSGAPNTLKYSAKQK